MSKTHFLLFLILFFIQGSVVFAQGKVITRTRYHGMKIEDFRNRKDDPIFRIDSIGFSIVEGDTIVKISKTEKESGKWVRVPYEPRDSAFLEKYKKIVFNVNGSSHDSTATIKYWRKPIKVYFETDVKKVYKKELIKLAKRIDKQIDSLKIEFVSEPEAANYFIQNFERNPLPTEPVTKRYQAYKGYRITWNNAQQFTKCYFRIDPIFGRQKQQIISLRKRFVQSLGLFYYRADFPCESYFSDCFEKNCKLTTEDLELLRYHYSYGICKGTPLEEFEAQHQRAREMLSKNPNNKMGFMHKVEGNK